MADRGPAGSAAGASWAQLRARRKQKGRPSSASTPDLLFSPSSSAQRQPPEEPEADRMDLAAASPPSAEVAGDTHDWAATPAPIGSRAPFVREWRRFTRQADALEEMERREAIRSANHAEHLRPPAGSRADDRPFLFSAETSRTGSRVYYVLSIFQFWTAFINLGEASRVLYEVIRERAPCRLYLDVEYSLRRNPATLESQVVEQLFALLQESIQAEFSIALRPEHVLDLDSTSPKKFSRHWILHLPSVVFSDNRACGEFVHKTWAIAQADRARFSSLFVRPSGGSGNSHVVSGASELVSVIDLGVYSKNRCFRLLGNHKFGKQATLRLREDHAFPYNNNDRKLFCDSLITNVRVSKSSVVYQAKRRAPSPSRFPLAAGASARAAGGPAALSASGAGSSPLEEVDAFVTMAMRSARVHGACGGSIVRWELDVARGRLAFRTAGNRFCGRIQRQHRSNNVFLDVDLSHGIYTQGCYDPECQAAGFVSAPYGLPRSLALRVRSSWLELRSAVLRGSA